MTTVNIIEGLKTLLPYYGEDNGYHVSAEHDQIHTRPTKLPMKPEDVQKMWNLGWFQEECEDNEYVPDAGWGAFV